MALTGIRGRASAAHEKGTKGGLQPAGLQCWRGQQPVISGLVPQEGPRGGVPTQNGEAAWAGSMAGASKTPASMPGM